MRNLIRVVFFLSILAQAYQLSFASEISFPLSDQSNIILLSGEIQKGDAEKLAKAAMLLVNPFYPNGGVLFLDSPGGDIEESLKIASLVKALHLNTIVAGRRTLAYVDKSHDQSISESPLHHEICASACFFIFLAGDMHSATGTINGRMTNPVSGYIGLHRPYFRLSKQRKNSSLVVEAIQHDLMQEVTAYLRNQDVSQRLIDIMMSRPSNDIYWMTKEDLEQLGDYSPGREEMLISRCGYSRKIQTELSAALETAQDNQDMAASSLIIDRLKFLGKCTGTAFPDLIEETLTNIERLQKGWRPWLKSKVARKK